MLALKFVYTQESHGNFHKYSCCSPTFMLGFLILVSLGGSYGLAGPNANQEPLLKAVAAKATQRCIWNLAS